MVPESDEQVLEHFLTNSDWDERGVLDQVALDADALLGGSERPPRPGAVRNAG